MWRIKVSYSDGSLLTLSHAGTIDLRLAQKYYNEYVRGKSCTAIYQQYPKKSNEPVTLLEKLNQLVEEVYTFE